MAPKNQELSQKVNILLVDDRPDGLLALEAVLGCPEYNLVKAASGAEALASLYDTSYAVILLDVQMPNMDGFETAKLIRQHEPSQDTPIIFITAINKDTAHIYEGYRSGAVDYLLKPFDPIVLKAKVRIFVELYQKKMKIREQAGLLLEYQSQITKTITDNASVGLIMTDRDGRITFMNPAVQAMTGYAFDELRGRRLHQLAFHHHDGKEADGGCMLEKISEPIRQHEDVFVRKDGSSFHALCSLSPLNQNRVLSGAVIEIIDITERKEAEEALKSATHQLARSNRDLEQFAYVASHDLQEPLRKILSFSDRLKENTGTIGQAERDYLERMQNAAKRMKTLIEDLLNFSRVSVGEDLFEEIDLRDAVKEALSDLEVSIHRSGANVEVGRLPIVRANRLQMRQFFMNMTGNSIKFSKKDQSPHVKIYTAVADDGYEIRIEDNGIGFDEKYLDRIFKPFQRLHGRSEFEGTGIGLAICQKISQNHGGYLNATSRPGKGSTFIFHLPAKNVISFPPAEQATIS